MPQTAEENTLPAQNDSNEQASAQGTLRDLTLATWVAGNVIEQTRIEGEPLGPGRRQGRSRMGHQTWFWEMDIRGTDVAGIVRLEVEADVVSLSAILLDPIYFEALQTGKRVEDGVTILDQSILIPFKAKAFLDLTRRRYCQRR